MDKVYDVIIAGAGPVGLFLACELALQGTSVLVLERELEPSNPWKAEPLGLRGLNTISVEAFYRRGLLNKVSDKRASAFQKTFGFQFAGHFAGLAIDGNKLDIDGWKYRLNGPALLPSPTTIERVEKTLLERAESLGVRILRGHGVTEIIGQNDENVTIEAGDHQAFRGKWLVGCDGGRSAVRKAAGIDFIGTEAKFTGYVAQCDFDHAEKLKPGFNPTKNGMYIMRKPDTLYLMDFDDGAFDRSQEITNEHLENVFHRISGNTDVKINKVHLASAFTDRSKQAATYRKGRVLLAGDAAHIFSPLGAQGMNAGLGDAMNLGWKLAATVRAEARAEGRAVDMTLLDTYESERRPVAASVIDWSRAQVSTLEPTPYGAATQALIRDLVHTTDGANLFIERSWGITLRYTAGLDVEHAHPLVGYSVPDFEILDGSRLGSRLESGNGLLVDFDGNNELMGLVENKECDGRVAYLNVGVKDRRGLQALLVRPDGFVAWAAENDTEINLKAAKDCLRQWFEH